MTPPLESGTVRKPFRGVSPRQRKMDTLVGTLLLIGVLLSMALIGAGLAWSYLRTGRLFLGYRIAGMNFFQYALTTGRDAAAGAAGPQLLVNAGIVVLMLTPFLRVLASMFYFFAVLKNIKYTLFTAFVLLVLTWSLFLR